MSDNSVPTEALTIDRLPALASMHDSALLYIVLNNQDYHITAATLKQLLLANMPPAPLPEGLVSEDMLAAAIEAFLTGSDLETKLADAISAAAYQLPASVVHQNQIAGFIAADTGFQGVVQDVATLKSKDTVTTQQLSDAFSSFQPTLPTDLVRTADLAVVTRRTANVEQAAATLAETVSTLRAEQDAEAGQEASQNQAIADLGTAQASITSRQDAADLAIADAASQANSGISDLDGRVTALENAQGGGGTDPVPALAARVDNAEQNVADLQNVTRAQGDSISGLLVRVQGQEDRDIVSSSDLSVALQNYTPTLPGDLVREQALMLVENRVGALEAQETVTPQQLADAVGSIVVPTDVVGQAALDAVATRVGALEAAETVSPTQLADAIAAAAYQLPEDVVRSAALDGLAQAADVEAKLTKPTDVVADSVMGMDAGEAVQKTLQQGRVYYVNRLSTAASETGSLLSPFKTIQAALNAAPSVSVIQVFPGTYTEDLVFPRDNVLVQGFGCFDAIITEIRGTMTIGDAARPTNTRVRLKDLSLRNNDLAKPALKFGPGALRHYFNNVTIEPMAGTTVPLVSFEGAVTNWVDFTFCSIGGEISFAGTPTNKPAVFFRECNHDSMVFNVQENYTLHLNDVNRLAQIIHANGDINLFGVRGFVGVAGVGIESTTDTGRLVAQFSSLLKADGTFVKLNKTGNGGGVLAQMVRDTANDVVNGSVTLV